MFLAVLHIAYDTPSGRARKEAWEAAGLSLFNIMPTQAPASAAREFPPEVVVVELADRPVDALRAVDAVLGVPRQRGDRWPLVLAEVRPIDRAEAVRHAPHAVIVRPGATPDEVLDACLQAISDQLAAGETV